MLKKIDKKFTFFLEWALIIALNLIAILMFIQVLFRYVLQLPLNFIEELLVIPGIWFYILGSVYASKKEEHLNARIIEIFFKRVKSIATLRALTAALSTFVCGWLIYWSYDLCKYSFKVNKASTILGYPMSIIEVSLFVGFVLMFIYTVAELVKYINVVNGKRKELN
ncbi:MAG: TRAP transporter small permease subunit [Synergistes jonesii]|uniref:TRAP transporter small permease n=1 Tax=Synergistes jonesii TaxID=2754 RepID=UPI002A748634|nr:TRAP transporter small permease subunit [Synergistes jonesii]MDY2985583.1 TRAP transporter small permease subunit [Synergistes jonesii]